MSKAKWEKRFSFCDTLFFEDYVISKLREPYFGYHLERVTPDGQTLKHFGTYSKLEAAMFVAERDYDERGIQTNG